MSSHSNLLEASNKMDVVLECKDERAEGACNAESNTFGIIFEASTILLTWFNSRGLHARLNYSHEACANYEH
jgi:hypothetical protein